MSQRIGIIYCQRIQDTSCVGCAKCYKAVNRGVHAFAGSEEDVRVVFKTGCGDCPGLVIPKLDLQLTVLEELGEEVDALYFGTCVKKAKALMSCPMNLDGVRGVLEQKWGVPVEVGTHQF